MTVGPEAAAELARLGLYDPAAPDADQRLALVEFLMERETTIDEIRSAVDLQSLAALAFRHTFGVAGDRVTLSEAAARTGVAEERAAKILRAAGLPDPELQGVHAGSVRLIELFSTFAELVGEDQALHLARIINSSVVRIAEAGMAATRVNVEIPLRAEGIVGLEFMKLFAEIGEDLFVGLNYAVDAVFREKLVELSLRSWDVDAEGSAMIVEQAVGFADIVGFSERVDVATMKDLAQIVDDFESRVSDALVRAGGRVAKLIGDEVMFVADDAPTACECASALVGLAVAGAIPDVRIGVAFGNVMSRFGDIYGPVVNIAARLVAIASPGEVLVTAPIAERAEEFSFETQVPRRLKGIAEPVEHSRLCGRA